MKPISSLSPFTDILFKIRPAGTKTDTPLARLEAGQRIQALVVESQEQGALLEYRRHRFRAATRTRLRAGQEVGLEVVRTAPFIQFSLLQEETPGQIARTVHLLSQGWPLAGLKSLLAGGNAGGDPEALPSAGQEALQRFLELAGKSSGRVRVEDLAFLLRRLGMTRERDLAEGRGEEAARTVKNGLEEVFLNGRVRSDQDNGVLWQALQRIELLQLLAVRLGEQGAMLYPLPLGMVRDGYLVVHERKGGESEEAESPPLKVSLFLDFRRLGPIRVDLLKDSVGVFVRVACGSEQVLERIAAGKEVLEQSLLSMKVPLQSLTLVQGAIPAAAALLQMATGEEQRVFSARV